MKEKVASGRSWWAARQRTRSSGHCAGTAVAGRVFEIVYVSPSYANPTAAAVKLAVAPLALSVMTAEFYAMGALLLPDREFVLFAWDGVPPDLAVTELAGTATQGSALRLVDDRG